MIISASRRTDIPAFYAEWLIRRLRAGYCTVPNPLNRNQVSRISLRPEDVDVIVFWTRNARPLMTYLEELDSRGYRYYFQYTIVGNPWEIDPKSPPVATAVQTFCELSEQLGPNRVIWRYDPIVFTDLTPPAFHRENFQRIAESLRNRTRRSVVSIVDMYRKTESRMKDLEGTPAAVRLCDCGEFQCLMRDLADLARINGMDIVRIRASLIVASWYCNWRPHGLGDRSGINYDEDIKDGICICRSVRARHSSSNAGLL